MQHFHPVSKLEPYFIDFLDQSINQFYDDLENIQSSLIIDDKKYHLIDYGEQTLLHLYSIVIHKLWPDKIQLFEFGTNNKNRGDLLIQDSKNKKLIVVEAKRHPSNPNENKKWKDQIETYYMNLFKQAEKYYDYLDEVGYKEHFSKDLKHYIMTLSFDINSNPGKSENPWGEYLPQLENEYFFYREFPFFKSKKGLAIYGLIVQNRKSLNIPKNH